MSMKRIDFKTITAEVVAALSSLPLEQQANRRVHGHMTNLSNPPVAIRYTPDEIRSSLINGVWTKGVAVLNGDRTDCNPLEGEKALAILTRKGMVTENVQFKRNSFRLKLKNAEYRIYKYGGTGFEACPWPSLTWCPVTVSGEEFAEFLAAFDSEIPEIESNLDTVMARIKARELEMTRQKKERELKDKLVKSLVLSLLAPLGLSTTYSISEGDIVSLDLRKVMTAHLDIPLEKLAETLKDTAGIEEALSVERPRTYNDDDF